MDAYDGTILVRMLSAETFLEPGCGLFWSLSVKSHSGSIRPWMRALILRSLPRICGMALYVVVMVVMVVVVVVV